MNTIFSQCAVTCVNHQTKRQTRYLLLCLTENQGRATYALWILNDETHAIECVGDDLSLANRLFAQAVEGDLSPFHLYDWLSDCKKERFLSFER